METVSAGVAVSSASGLAEHPAAVIASADNPARIERRRPLRVRRAVKADPVSGWQRALEAAAAA
ncbi:MAG: hypothetical protein R3E83_15955 [Burkholderiaceae bacterium]